MKKKWEEFRSTENELENTVLKNLKFLIFDTSVPNFAKSYEYGLTSLFRVPRIPNHFVLTFNITWARVNQN